MRLRTLSKDDRALVQRAWRVMESALVGEEVALSDPAAVRRYLSLRYAPESIEHCVVLLLDSRNRLIAVEEVSRGTVAQAVVYPREVVRAAITHNAAAVILAHNHPSGLAEPSAADRRLTDVIKAALATVDIPVLDHIIVAGAAHYSFAEKGLL